MLPTSHLPDNPRHKILSAPVTFDLRGETFILIRKYQKSAFHMVLQNSYLCPSMTLEMFSLSSGRHFHSLEGTKHPILGGSWEGRGVRNNAGQRSFPSHCVSRLHSPRQPRLDRWKGLPHASPSHQLTCISLQKCESSEGLIFTSPNLPDPHLPHIVRLPWLGLVNCLCSYLKIIPLLVMWMASSQLFSCLSGF